MNSRRTVILIIAIVVSAVSALGLARYVQGVEDDVYDGAALGSVWVVQTEIPKGTPAEQAIGQGLISQTEVPVEFIPPTAIQDPGLELDNLVAVVDLPPASFLVAGNFVAPNVISTGITDRLEERGMHTVTFSIDDVGGVAGFVQPGDFVNILVLRDIAYAPEEEEGEEGDGETGGEDGGDATTNADGAGGTIPQVDGLIYENELPTSAEEAGYLKSARYLYQKVEVLAVGDALPLDLGESASEDDETARSGLITLAVPPDGVQRILGVGLQNIYLSLIPPTYEPDPILPLDISELLYPGEDERLTPYYATEPEEAPAE